jgi:prolyl-tRNA synthetase
MSYASAAWTLFSPIQVDGNDMKTPGWRYNYWELKGVPLRIEVGPRDVEQGTCVLARRDMPGAL